MAGMGAANAGAKGRHPDHREPSTYTCALLVCLLLWKSDKRAKSHNTLAPALRLAGLERVHCSCGQRSLTPTRTASCPGPEATERPGLPASAVRLCLWLPQVKGQQAKGCSKPALVVRGNTLLPSLRVCPFNSQRTLLQMNGVLAHSQAHSS